MKKAATTFVQLKLELFTLNKVSTQLLEQNKKSKTKLTRADNKTKYVDNINWEIQTARDW